MTCPDYYRLADGREFCEFQREMLIPLCVVAGFDLWTTHCILSACEHLFRMGAKPDEEESDKDAMEWWWPGVTGPQLPFSEAIFAIVESERRKVGR